MQTRTNRHDGKIEALRSLPVLAGLSDAELLRLAALAELIEVPAEAQLTREGESAREAFLVIEGRLRVERAGLVVARLGPGDLAGDVSLLDRQPRATAVVAQTPARLAVLTRSALQQLARSSRWFTDHLVGQLAARVRAGPPT